MIFDMEKTLEQQSIIVKLSDPWDLGERLNWEPLSAVVVAVDNNSIPEKIILRMIDSFEYENVQCEYFVASPRHEGGRLNDIQRNKGVICGLTRIPDERLQLADPFDLKWWRGGPALIGELRSAQ